MVWVGLGPKQTVGDDVAHAGTKSVTQAAVQVAQGFAGGLRQFAAIGQQGSQGRRQGVPRPRENRLQAGEFFFGKHFVGGGKHIFNRLIGRPHTGHQRVGHAKIMGRLGNVSGAGSVFSAPVRQQPTPQGAVATDQHGGLWQQQVFESLQVLLYRVFVPPRQAGHVGHHRYVGVVRGDARHSAQVFCRADESHFDDRHLDIFEHSTGLLVNCLVIQCEMAEYLRRVPCIGPSNDRQGMGTHGGHGRDIGGQAADAAGITGIEDQHTARAGEISAIGLTRQLVGVGRWHIWSCCSWGKMGRATGCGRGLAKSVTVTRT